MYRHGHGVASWTSKPAKVMEFWLETEIVCGTISWEMGKVIEINLKSLGKWEKMKKLNAGDPNTALK